MTNYIQILEGRYEKLCLRYSAYEEFLGSFNPITEKCDRLIFKIDKLKNELINNLPPINKDFYCDAMQGSMCEHFKENYCQFKDNCSMKHPDN